MATPEPEAHVGDTPEIVKIVTDGTAVVDLSAATLKTLEFNGPGAVLVSLAMDFVTDGTDGQLKVTLLVGTWSVAGRWLEQVHITIPEGDFACTSEQRTVLDRIF